MYFKPGVSIRGVQAELVLVLYAIDEIHKSLFGGQEMTVTSLMDGFHSPNSYHYKGLAADIRTKDIELFSDKELFRSTIAATFPECDVLLEKLGQPQEHIHCEVDQRKVV